MSGCLHASEHRTCQTTATTEWQRPQVLQLREGQVSTPWGASREAGLEALVPAGANTVRTDITKCVLQYFYLENIPCRGWGQGETGCPWPQVPGSNRGQKPSVPSAGPACHGVPKGKGDIWRVLEDSWGSWWGSGFLCGLELGLCPFLSLPCAAHTMPGSGLMSGERAADACLYREPTWQSDWREW